MKNKSNKFITQLQAKRKIVVSDPVSFTPKFSLVLTKLQYFLLIFATILIVAILVYFTIAYTSLKKLVPGYPSVDNIKEFYETDANNIKYLEELAQENHKRDLWIKNLLMILGEKDSVLFSHLNDSVINQADYKNIVFERKIEDSLLRKKVDKEQRLQDQEEVAGLLKSLNFILPVNGRPLLGDSTKRETTLTFLVDNDQLIKATMGGTVITSHRKQIVVQHAENLLGVYQNCGDISVYPGEEITRGKQMAITGDTIFYFTLWYNGKFVDINEIKNSK